jgi:hypothetical protein
MHSEFWKENLKEREHLDDLGVDGRIILYRSKENRMGGCEQD